MYNNEISLQQCERNKLVHLELFSTYLHEFTLSESAAVSSKHPFQGDGTDRGFGVEQCDLDDGAGHLQARMAQRHLQGSRDQPRPEPGQALCGEPH